MARRYGLALAIAGLALATRLIASPFLGVQAPFVTFYVAVVITARLLGYGPAIVVALIGTLSATYFFLEPLQNLWIQDRTDTLWVLIYMVVSGTLIWALEAERRARQSSEENARLAMERLEALQREAAERERAQRAEVQQREWYETTLRSIGDAVIATDNRRRVSFLNATAESLTGWSAEDAAGKDISAVFVIRDEQTGEPADPVELVRRQGRAVGLENHTVLLSRTGRTVPIEDSAAPIRDPEGRLTGVVLVFRDITERRSAERVLQHNAAEMERFAYLASHDLQEPLRTVSSFARLLEHRYGGTLDDVAAEYLQVVVGGTERMQRLVSDLLEYSRVGAQSLSLKEVPSKQILDDAISALRAQIEACDAKVTHDRLPTIYGDRVKLTQVFQNLLANSMKFRSEVRCRIHIWACQIDGFWCFSVRDNGIGFEPQHADRIFAMFQRLCSGPDYEGSGLGLAIARRVVESHGGRIWAESVPGKGATFQFTIPLTTQLGKPCEVEAETGEQL